MNNHLHFRSDGTFTILQFSDLHWKNGEPADLRTRALMERVLKQEKPDLIIITGDVIESLCCKEPVQSYRDALSVVEESGIPWVTVFGNHDAERNVSKEQLMKVLQEYSGSLVQAGPAEVDGVGNFVVQVTDAKGLDVVSLYFLDSGSYSELPSVAGYDWIRNSQIEWFRAQASSLQKSHGGVPVPSLVFFHIPLPEYKEVWNRYRCEGSRYEKVQSPQLNSGFFGAMVQSGGVMGTFCGHDHINDYTGWLHGIRLCYGRSSGYNTYGRWLFPRGARVIRLQRGQEGFTTWLRLANGKKVEGRRYHTSKWFSRA